MAQGICSGCLMCSHHLSGNCNGSTEVCEREDHYYMCIDCATWNGSCKNEGMCGRYEPACGAFVKKET